MVGGTKVREGAGEGAPGARARIPLEPPAGDHGGAAISLQPVERTRAAGGKDCASASGYAPKELCRTPTRSSLFLKGFSP